MSFLSRLTMIIHKYFEENTFQYSSGRRRLYVCVVRAGPWIKWTGIGPRIQAVATYSPYQCIERGYAPVKNNIYLDYDRVCKCSVGEKDKIQVIFDTLNSAKSVLIYWNFIRFLT